MNSSSNDLKIPPVTHPSGVSDKEYLEGWDDMGEAWRDINKARQEKRRSNLTHSTKMIQDMGIPHIVKNGGVHLIITFQDKPIIDYWPSTGLWIIRETRKSHRGIRSLVNYYHDLKGTDNAHERVSGMSPSQASDRILSDEFPF